MLLKKMGLPISGYFSATILYLCFSTSVFALSVSTVNTIKGTMPALSIDGGKTIISDLNELLYMTLPDGTKFTPDMSTTIKVPLVPFNQFGTLLGIGGATKPLPMTYYYDKDGDLERQLSPVTGDYSAILKNADGVEITDLTTKADACDAPYTLTINMSQSSIFSEYGDPSSAVYPARSVTYTLLVPDTKLCYLKPGSMGKGTDWIDVASNDWNIGSGTISSTNGGGYTKDFVPNKGFIINPIASIPTGAKFPTTGFSGAFFQMMMSGGQDQYTYSVAANPSNSVDIDPSTGIVTLVSKPSGSVTLTATSINNLPSVAYTFNLDLWAVPLAGQAKLPESIDKCAALGYSVLTLSDITNSPARNPTLMDKYNYFTRAIGGSIGAEWGYLAAYDKSDWLSGSYWSSDSASGSAQYYVDAYIGTVVRGDKSMFSAYVACRG